MTTKKPQQNQTESEDISLNQILEVSEHVVEEARHQAIELVHLPGHVFSFFRHPINTISTLKPAMTATWILLSIGTGVIASLLNALLFVSWQRWIVILIGLFLLPLGAFLSVFLTAWYLKIVLKTLHKTRLRFRYTATILSFSNIWWWLGVGLEQRIPFAATIGFLFSVYLMRIGFIRSMGIPSKVISPWVLLLALLHSGIWIIGRFWVQN